MRQVDRFKQCLAPILACCFLVGCSAGVGLPAEQTMEIAAERNCAQVAGIWEVSERIASGTCSDVGQSLKYSYVIVQDGCEVKIQDSEALGVVEGNVIHWQGHTVGEESLVRGIEYHLLVEPYDAVVAGDNLKYQCQWHYMSYDNIEFCSGKSAMSAVRLVR